MKKRPNHSTEVRGKPWGPGAGGLRGFKAFTRLKMEWGHIVVWG